MNIKETLLANRRIHEVTGCWLWTGRLNKKDYGVLSLPIENPINSKTHRDYLIHRLSYQEFIGPITNCILHKKFICLFHNCFNPEHLYDGTHQENMEDQIATANHGNQYGRTDKTHCKNNHLLEGENLLITSEGRRRCKICRTEYNKKNWKKYV